jgi:hypothetical protein
MTSRGRLLVRQRGNETEIVAELERRRAEALALEVASLAKRYGLTVQLERVGSNTPDSRQ